MPTTVIKNAAWVIAWDEARGKQVYRRGVDLAFTDDRISFLGPGFAGHADRVIDGAGLLVIPGLIDIHSHPEHEPLYRGIREQHYRWDEQRGRAGFSAALDVIDAALAHPCRRLSGVVSPAQIDTCTPDLLRDSHAAAKERGLPFTVHVAQSVVEVREMIRRHGQTPVQWAYELGLLGPGTILGHALFLDSHSWIRWHTRIDLKILGDSGAAVAHCPTPFVRYGHLMENFGDYLRAGVTMGLGTDCAPHNLIEEMRKATVLAHIAARDITSVTAAEMFHAATVGGANALLRDDIGRLAPGKKADLVLVDLACPQMQPDRDPLKSLIYHAADRAVREVFVDGRQVVADGRVTTMDQAAASAKLRAAQERMEALAPSRDYLRRSAAEIAPLSLPVRE